MANLNEYLGGIVSSITEGRVMADLKSVKVAEEYANHPLLQHFSIPRMRIGDIELTIPVALETYAPTETIKTYEPLPKSFNEAVLSEFSKALGFKDFTKEFAAALNTEIANKSKILNQEIQASRSLVPIKSFAQSLSIFVLKQASTTSLAKHIKMKGIDLEKVEAQLTERLATYVKPTTTTSAGTGALEVIVEASKLKEQRPESIIQIKMRLTEDGLEWNRSENSKGEKELRLLPE